MHLNDYIFLYIFWCSLDMLWYHTHISYFWLYIVCLRKEKCNRCIWCNGCLHSLLYQCYITTRQDESKMIMIMKMWMHCLTRLMQVLLLACLFLWLYNGLIRNHKMVDIWRQYIGYTNNTVMERNNMMSVFCCFIYGKYNKAVFYW